MTVASKTAPTLTLTVPTKKLEEGAFDAGAASASTSTWASGWTGISAPLSLSFALHHTKRSVPSPSTCTRLNGATYVRPACEYVWCVASSSSSADQKKRAK